MNEPIKVLELFCGTKSFSNVAESLDMQVYTMDVNKRFKSHYIVNIFDFNPQKVPFIPDIFWASPPCTWFSVASQWKHWNKDRTPKTIFAQCGIDIVKKTIEVMEYFQRHNRDLLWYLENPRGMLRNMDFMQGYTRHTVTYCQYGDNRMKPTDIWTNNTEWVPRPLCDPQDKCHTPNATNNLNTPSQRSVIPPLLCEEILQSSIQILSKEPTFPEQILFENSACLEEDYSGNLGKFNLEKVVLPGGENFVKPPLQEEENFVKTNFRNKEYLPNNDISILLDLVSEVVGKPYETYFGGKEASGSFQKIINNIRPHQSFISLFLGNCAVLRNLKPCKRRIGVDLNPEVIEKWQGLRVPDLFLISADGIEALSQMTMGPGTVVYCDPPYPIGSRRSKKKVYKYEMTDEDHHRFLEVVKKKENDCDFLISTYENDIYKEALKDWNIVKYQSATRGGLATEFLYMNYENKEGHLHDYRYLGADFTERQRIKRKINRWVNKLKGLNPSEMRAIIYAIDSRID